MAQDKIKNPDPTEARPSLHTRLNNLEAWRIQTNNVLVKHQAATEVLKESSVNQAGQIQRILLAAMEASEAIEQWGAAVADIFNSLEQVGINFDEAVSEPAEHPVRSVQISYLLTDTERPGAGAHVFGDIYLTTQNYFKPGVELLLEAIEDADLDLADFIGTDKKEFRIIRTGPVPPYLVYEQIISTSDPRFDALVSEE